MCMTWGKEFQDILYSYELIFPVKQPRTSALTPVEVNKKAKFGIMPVEWKMKNR